VDTAYCVVGEVAPLVGAAGFQHSHPIAEARADLTGLLYSDGIHDSLYRSGGRQTARLAVYPRSGTRPHRCSPRLRHKNPWPITKGSQGATISGIPASRSNQK